MSTEIWYRRLSLEELNSMEKEFIHFLIVQGHDATDWEKIKEENEELKETFIIGFSNQVFHKILLETKYLLFRSPKVLRSFQCLTEKMVCMTMEIEPDSILSFSDPNIMKTIGEHPNDVLLFQTEKPFGESREKEIFQMIQEGCEISDGKVFTSLALAYADL